MDSSRSVGWSADGDIGDVVVFLCSDDAALNGATLMADGGRAYLR
jgi:NAD(P)-dependent dehydrogenase (short-subunit alcohol dehydrogenase family)